MMFAFSESQLLLMVSQYFLPFARIAAFFMAGPIFGTRVVSMRVRLVLGVAITALISPLLPSVPAISAISVSMLLMVLQQVLIGVALGFMLQVVFQVFVLSGQYIAMKMGLGFASMNDPASGVSVTIVSQFYLLTTTLLFLSFNGHLALVQMLVDSFNLLPISQEGQSSDSFYRIANMGGWMFGSALTITMPVLTALLVVNIAFGVMSRTAPQMNIFAVGFPITLIFGLLIMWVAFPPFLTVFEQYINEGMEFTLDVLSGVKP